MSPTVRSLVVAFIGMVLAGSASADVVVSSKIDTEGSVLGNIILLALEANGVKTQDRIQLGGTPVVRAALLSGEIDIYPEYTGDAALFFNKAGDAVWKNAAAGFAEAKALDYAANKIVWLRPAPADNAWAIALRKDVAEANRLETLSDFGKWVAGGGRVALAASAEFVNSASGLPAFQSAYGFKLSSRQLIVLSGGDTAATIKAAAERTSGADAAMVYTSDGAIEASGLVVLADEKHVQPIYEPAPIIREKVLRAYPAIATVLAPVFASLDLAVLRGLNAKVQVEGLAAQARSRADYLKEQRFRQISSARAHRAGAGPPGDQSASAWRSASLAPSALTLAPFTVYRPNRVARRASPRDLARRPAPGQSRPC